MLEHNIPVFKEVEERKIVANKDEGYNFLLEGDNLHSLKLLEKTHKGKIDVIYIDPPYNTGNKDFIYNDKYVDKTDGYSHSKWLSFMSERLEIARELLSDDGVIFISIDDNEQAQLKLLCDEVFGEENFVGKYMWYKSTTPANLSKKIKKNLEYVLCYEKNKNNLKYKSILKESSSNNGLMNQTNKEHILIFPENLVDTSLKDGIYKKGKYGTKNYNIELLEDTEVKNSIFVKKVKLFGKFKWSQDYLDNEINKGTLISIKTIAFSPSYLKLEKEEDVPSNLINKDYGVDTTENAGKKLEKILGKNVFSYPKPTSLIKYLIKFTENGRQNNIILDFFAGSGTTGHAVMQLNKEDGGNRKYILCTNNENNICEEVTYQRLKNIQEELPHNLKYLKTDFISKYESEEDEETISEKMLEHVKELIELEYHVEMDGMKYIVLDDEDEIEEVVDKIEEDGKLFITEWVFLGREHKRKLEEKNVEVINIPEYYYRDELQELGEI